MTHHTNDKSKEAVDEIKGAKKEAGEEGFIDYSDVNQGVDTIVPDPTDTSTVELPKNISSKKGKGSKGKGGKGATIGGGKGASELARLKDQITCSFCGVNMAFGGTATVVPVTGKKVPKNAKGQYTFRSPGAESEGKMAGVLCEACARVAANSPEGAIDIKTVIAVTPDGVRNIPVKDFF